MKPLTDLEREQLMHQYDPVKAHEYYLRTRELTGRKRGNDSGFALKPKHTRAEIAASARARQRKELSAAINNLQARLQKLEALIKQRAHEEASVNRKSKAKKERAAKEHTKPKTAAEKAKIARENEKYRDKHKQKLKSASKKSDGKSGGGSSRNASKTSSKHSLSELKSLATKVRGQIEVAKHKLAAL